MKAQIVASTFGLILGLYGMTPAMAESFDDRGADWTATSQMPTPYQSQSRMPAQDTASANSWSKGSGKTPLEYKATSSSSRATAQSCDLSSKRRWNNSANPTC
jgi:hypothetical protein